MAEGGRRDAGARGGRVLHTLDPVFDDRSRVLGLGPMPSPASREACFYYGHPRNRFWRVMETLAGLPAHALDGNAERTAFLLERGIALWDVLASCEIRGAADATIRDPVPNDLSVVLDRAPVEAVFTTGAQAARLYRSLSPFAERFPPHELPSTSPANARMRLPDLVEAYRAVFDALAWYR